LLAFVLTLHLQVLNSDKFSIRIHIKHFIGFTLTSLYKSTNDLSLGLNYIKPNGDKLGEKAKLRYYRNDRNLKKLSIKIISILCRFSKGELPTSKRNQK
jgi:hypothetical protein